MIKKMHFNKYFSYKLSKLIHILIKKLNFKLPWNKFLENLLLQITLKFRVSAVVLIVVEFECREAGGIHVRCGLKRCSRV